LLELHEQVARLVLAAGPAQVVEQPASLLGDDLDDLVLDLAVVVVRRGDWHDRMDVEHAQLVDPPAGRDHEQ